jgi:hypothetical protein
MYLPLVPVRPHEPRPQKAKAKHKPTLTLAMAVAKAWRWCLRHLAITKPTPTITKATGTTAEDGK